jgi:hypothetical protein
MFRFISGHFNSVPSMSKLHQVYVAMLLYLLTHCDWEHVTARI